MNEFNPEFSSPIKIGISACLTGDQVRFDKSHKKSDFCMNQLGKHVEYEKFCPEVAVGLPIPRPTIRQIKYDDVIAVSRPDGSMDVTEKMTEFGQKVASRIDHLSGFVFMKGSPSCGMERVKVYYEHVLKTITRLSSLNLNVYIVPQLVKYLKKITKLN